MLCTVGVSQCATSGALCNRSDEPTTTTKTNTERKQMRTPNVQMNQQDSDGDDHGKHETNSDITTSRGGIEIADGTQHAIGIGPLCDITGFQVNLLTAVYHIGPAHGIGIKDYLEQYYAGEIHHARLYPNLDSLVEKGFIHKTEADGRTNEYRLTSRGERELLSDHYWRLGEHLEGGQDE